MPVRTRLPRRVVLALETVREEIRTIAEMERTNFDEMSERWHEGDRAAVVSDWLDALDDVVGEMDAISLPDDV